MINESKVEMAKMVKSLDVESNKQKKKPVEDAVFIGYLNQKLEDNHSNLFCNRY